MERQAAEGYDARAIANIFLSWARENGPEKREGFTPLEINKIVYIAHGWCLAILKKPLISDQVLAWKHGPVIRSIYDAFKRFGRDTIQGCAEYGPRDRESGGEVRSQVAEEYLKVLQAVYHAYDDFVGYEWAHLTHKPNSPWDQARKNSEKVISNDSIRAEYESIRSRQGQS